MPERDVAELFSASTAPKPSPQQPARPARPQDIAGPGCREHSGKALHNRSFFTLNRTKPAYPTGGPGLRALCRLVLRWPNTAWPNNSGTTAVLRPTTAATTSRPRWSRGPRARSATSRFPTPAPTASARPRWTAASGYGSTTDLGRSPSRRPQRQNLSTKRANCARWSTRASPQERTRRSQTPCENVSGVNTRTAYAICPLSYELAWNNASTVYGNTSTDEKRQHQGQGLPGLRPEHQRPERPADA